MFPDLRTVIAVILLLTTALGMLQLWLWWCNRSLHGLPWWGSAYLAISASLALLAGRGVLPQRLSVDAAVALLMLGYGFGWMGSRRFESRPISVPLALAGAVVWLVACHVPAIYLDLGRRVAFASCILGLYDLLCAHEFLRRREGGELPSRRALGIIFCAGAIAQAMRVTGALTSLFHQPVFALPASSLFGVPAAIGAMLGAVTCVLLISVAKEEAEQRSNAVLAEARDAADRANLAKSQFLARMSHELRTPLNGVLGMAQVLSRDPRLDGEQRERALLLEQSGHHLLAIINDLLDLASAEAGKFQLAPQPALVRDIIQASVDLVAGAAEAKRIALRLSSEPDLPIAVLGDPLRIRQILLNLLGNAIKFTPADGTVTLRAARLDRRGGLLLSVIDTGPGVPPEFRPHLFEDFAYLPVSTKPSGGTGLGLAISSSLAQAMGGRIDYQPGADGIGSTFTVTLPLAETEPPQVAVPQPAPAPALAIGLHILVVDDVAVNRMLAEALLRQAGHSVAVAADADAALTALRDGPLPDVVLMDVHMDGMDGLAATQRIRAMQGAAGTVPVIALTADASPDRAQAYRDAGMDAFVTKPIVVDELLTAIVRAVRPPEARAEALSLAD